MEEAFGGPVWHASGSTYDGNQRVGRQMAKAALTKVGDAALGEWSYAGERKVIWHVLRRLTAAERAEYGVPEPYDIRGTAEEARRMRLVWAEM